MQPRSRAGSRLGLPRLRDPVAPAPVWGPRSGYLLIEVAATLAIAGMAAGLAISTVGTDTTPGRLLALTSASVSLLREARTAAVAGNVAVAATFDARRRVLIAGAHILTIPADVDLSVLAGGNCPADRSRAQIVFRPDGTNCGGILRFAKGASVFRTRVNWVDGQIDVLRGG